MSRVPAAGAAAAAVVVAVMLAATPPANTGAGAGAGAPPPQGDKPKQGDRPQRPDGQRQDGARGDGARGDGARADGARGDGGRRGPMSAEMVDRIIEVADDVSPELGKIIREKRNASPEELSQAMRQNTRRLIGLAVLKERNPDLYKTRVEELRVQLELRVLGEQFMKAQADGDKAAMETLGAQIDQKVSRQIDLDLKARAQELLVLSQQMDNLRHELESAQANKDARRKEVSDAVRSGQPVKTRPFPGER